MRSWFVPASRRRSHQRLSPRNSLASQPLEQRRLLAAESIDGTGNNLAHPTWGSAGIDLLRIAPAQYGDGISTVGGTSRPSARAISDLLSAQGDVDILSDRQLSAMVYAWGQFIDHDMDLTLTGTAEPLKIPVPTGDPWFDPLGTGTKTIDTTRSNFDAATGTSTANPRQQINSITAFLDGSMVYGSDAATAASLRTMMGGHLKTSAGNLLPVDNTGAFLAGDIRANENIELTSMQTLFVREHNFWADKFAAQNPALSDEQLYQMARARVIAEIQAVTYNEWLPALLGPNALLAYKGYNPNVNPSIANEFSTAAFRFGHSMLGDDVEFLDNNGLPIRDEVSLSQAFFNPSLVSENGIDPILKYLSADPASEIDVKVVDSVRNFLFGQPGSGGLDLVSLNIQRGRDHGLADFNTVRQAYGLPKITSFSQITPDKTLQQQLQQLYGNVNNIDLWVGVLAEAHVPGASVGPTLKAIISDQFRRLRDGDRYWYQNQFTGQALSEIQQTTLADIIRRNTNLTSVQQDIFFFRAAITGTVFADSNADGKLNPKETGLAKQRLELVDALSGEVIALATTDPQGRYQFTVADGVRTGQYVVRLAGTTTITQTLSITSGGQTRLADLAVSTTKTPGKPAPQPGGPRQNGGQDNHDSPRHDGHTRPQVIDRLFAVDFEKLLNPRKK